MPYYASNPFISQVKSCSERVAAPVRLIAPAAEAWRLMGILLGADSTYSGMRRAHRWLSATACVWLAALATEFVLPVVWLDRASQTIDPVVLLAWLQQRPAEVGLYFLLAGVLSFLGLFGFSQAAARGMLGTVLFASRPALPLSALLRSHGTRATGLGWWLSLTWVILGLLCIPLAFATWWGLSGTLAAPPEVSARLSLAMLILGVSGVLFLFLTAGYFLLVLADFVVPAMVWYETSVTTAWALIWPRLKPHIGKAYLYVLIKLTLLSLIGIAAGWVRVILAPFVWIPALEVLVLMPLFLFLRLYSVTFTAQLLNKPTWN